MVQSVHSARLPPLPNYRWSWCLCTIAIGVGASFTQAYRAGPALCQHRALLQAQPPAADSNPIDGVIGPGLRAPDPAMAPAGEPPPLVDRGTLDPDSGRTSVGILTLIPGASPVSMPCCCTRPNRPHGCSVRHFTQQVTHATITCTLIPVATQADMLR